MADVTLTYKGSDILELSDSGSATLKTGGKYCEDDVTVEYVKQSGGGGVVTETFDIVVEKARSTVLYLPVSSVDYNNYVVSMAVVESGTYDGDTLVLDAEPTMPSWNQGTDFFSVYTMLSGNKFTGIVPAANGATTQLSGDYKSTQATMTSRTNQVQPYAGVGSTANASIIIYQNSSIRVMASRGFGAPDLYFKYRFKVYMWND